MIISSEAECINLSIKHCVCQASASCDGSVVVWNIEEQVRPCGKQPFFLMWLLVCDALIEFTSIQTQVISWPLLQKTNDVSNAKSLCRLAWQPAAAKVGDTAVRSAAAPPPRCG